VKGLFARVFTASAWRVRKLLGDRRVDDFLVSVALRWRPVLRKPVFVGIAGSAGKTTAKDLLHGMLSGALHGVASPGTLNVPPEVAKTVLRVRPNHAYCIAELSEHLPGIMDANLALFQPAIAIVTVVKDDHLAAFASREALAGEIAKLVHHLPASGTAVLNADDPLVVAMAAQCRAKVLTYGLAPEADVRAESVNAAWPDRLQMTLVYREQRLHVQTQLCGAHWLPSVLGAVGGGLAAGLTLAQCAKGLEGVEPFEGRMQPVTTPEGVTFIRDDFKAPLWTLEACFEFMKAAKAKRKIMVIGELSDIINKKEKRYEQVAQRAQKIADITVFIGPWATSALAARNASNPGALQIFNHVKSAADYINAITRDGDLVFLKGSCKQDHLERVILARRQAVACWRDDCQRNQFCMPCPDRMRASLPAALSRSMSAPHTVPITLVNSTKTSADAATVLIGLGNPGPQFANTPHNVGYALVDALAAANKLAWEEAPEGWLARGQIGEQTVCLVKIRSAMNLTGAGLHQLAQRLPFTPAQCVLVFDDLDLPLGSVRLRERGSAGGHKGVASILEAFQTDAFRRLKIGVAPKDKTASRATYVLEVFDAPDQLDVEKALVLATEKVGELLARPAQHT
jgi:UDP-N-acetylmuramoyl-tripeptide--D-alanyl-D-alanine ligase